MEIKYTRKLLMGTVKSHQLCIGRATCRVDWRPHDWISFAAGKNEEFLLSLSLMDHKAWLLKRSHFDGFEFYLWLGKLSIHLYTPFMLTNQK